MHLQLESLALCASRSDVYAALQNLPPSLESTYVRCLTRRQGNALVCNPKVLKWAAAAKEPLTVDHVREMLAIDPLTGRLDPDARPHVESILRSGVSLLSFDTGERSLVPIHHSARQFLGSTTISAEVVKVLPDLTEVTKCALDLSLEEAVLDIAEISLSHIKDRTGLEVLEYQKVPLPPVHGMVPPFVRKILRVKQPARVSLPVARARRPTPVGLEADFLQYAIRTWAQHTSCLTSERRCWEVFEHVSLTSNSSWKVHPWSSAETVTMTSHLRGLLGYAVSRNHVPLLRLLTQRPAILRRDVYDNALPGNHLLPALHVAAAAGYIEAVRLLLRLCSPNSLCPQKRRTALHYAVCNGEEEIVRLLLDSGKVDANSKDNHGQTPLSRAAQCDQEAVVRVLLESEKVNADSKDNHDQTPLSWAAEYGREAVVRVLLESERVDADFKDNFGRTPLSWAAERGHEAVVKVLLESEKVDANSKDNDGQTPLSLAAARGHEAMVRALLESGEVDADSKDNHGQTPLSQAAEMGHEAVVRVLLESGKVDVNCKDKNGGSALKYARKNRHRAVEKYLLDYSNRHGSRRGLGGG